MIHSTIKTYPIIFRLYIRPLPESIHNCVHFLIICSLVASEMRERFPGQNGSGGSSRRRLLQPYYPRRNYTASAIPRSISSRNQQSPRVQVRSTFTKNVVLLASDCSDVLPRGNAREKLHDSGQIANLVELDVNWCQEEVYGKIECRFPNLLDMSKPFPR